jgi:hypothetical protein
MFLRVAARKPTAPGGTKDIAKVLSDQIVLDLRQESLPPGFARESEIGAG